MVPIRHEALNILIRVNIDSNYQLRLLIAAGLLEGFSICMNPQIITFCSLTGCSENGLSFDIWGQVAGLGFPPLLPVKYLENMKYCVV